VLNKNIETFLGCVGEYRDADIVLFGAPFDSTTSYRPGTRFGSSAIRRESVGSRNTAPIRTPRFRMPRFSTAAIWSFALEMRRPLFQILNGVRKKF
jgi:arginase family enzyme